MNYLRMKSTRLLYLIFLILPCTLFSQNLDDFRTAASSNGVILIPFTGLREYFKKTLDQLSDVKSNPDKYLGSSPTDEDRKKLQDYVKVIEDQIQSNIQTHQDQEDGARKRKADFENLIKTTEYK
jgi:hypothetical protein